ncbi:hypothetical protein SCLCIDRAFT_134150, partial [Scleroderma citrinum Foug A]
DFVGQKRVDDISRLVLVVATIVSFVSGFALDSLRVTMHVFAFSGLALLVAVVPPWPLYTSHAVEWISST